MKIHQLSVTYLGDQDRLLVRVNTTEAEELRLWFTRRLMAGLWPLMHQMQTDQLIKQEASVTSGAAEADDDMKQMLANHRKTELLEQADFATPYKDDDARLPLGEAPLLVTEVKMTAGSNAVVVMEFAEQAEPKQVPRGFKIELDSRLMQGLVHLMEQALGHADWHIGATGPTDAPAPAEAPDSRPRYLN